MMLQELITGYTAAGGKLTGDDLRTTSRAAWRVLYYRTFGRVYSDDSHDDLIQECFNELVDTIHRLTEDGALASQTVGSWSQSYTDGSGGQSYDQVFAGIVQQWLSETGLLYRGVVPPCG